MKHLLLFAALTVGLASASVRADENVTRSGTLRAFCHSFALGGASDYFGSSDEIYFTTPDGKTSKPKTIKAQDGDLHGTDEVTPGSVAGEWQTDYFVTSLLNGKHAIVEYGNLKFYLPTTDANANNVPDVVDGDAPVHATALGVRTVDWIAPGRDSLVPVNYQLHLDRNAGAMRGTWTLGDPMTTFVGGYYETPFATGTFNYYRGPAKNFLDFFFTFPFAAGGFTSYSAPDPDHAAAKGITLAPMQGKPIKVNPFNLTRAGHMYWGPANFADGNTQTSIKDYTRWMFILNDPNDTDHDNILNLTDYRLPNITKHPVGRDLKIGASYTLSAAFKAPGKDPIGPVNFQWHFNGSPILGATQIKYKVENFGLDDVGDYRVQLQAPGGTVFSNPAHLQGRKN